MNPARYRVRLLFDICQTFLLPVGILHLILSYVGASGSYLTRAVLYLGSVASFTIVKAYWNDLLQRQEATSLKARPIPRVVGRWPGNLDILLRMMKDFKTSYILDVYLQLFREYKCTTLNLRILWRDTIITMDQEHTKYVLVTGFQRFWRGHAQKERLETFLGRGIFNRDDAEWKTHRAMARPFFAGERNRDFENFEKYTSRTLSILTSLASSNEAFDAQDLYARLTLDSASEFLFGKNLDTLSESRPLPGKTAMGPKGSASEGNWGSFARAFEAAQINATTRGRIGHWWPLFELLKDKNEAHAGVIHRWLDPLVQAALQEKQSRKEAGVASDISELNFLQHLAENADDAVIIRDQLLNMLLASRDTTAAVLTFLTYIMATHPHVTKRLREEVLEHCGRSAPTTHDQIRKMKYLRAVLNETLRLYPPVPLNVRETRSASCTFPSSDLTYSSPNSEPLYVPPNTLVMYLPLLTQRNPALWGEDADDFDPERWMDPERVAVYNKNPAMFTPFSSGPRICLGQNYAYNQMSYFVIRLIQRFDRFTLTPQYQPQGSLPPAEWMKRSGRQNEEKIWPAAALTLFVKGGLWVKCRLANN